MIGCIKNLHKSCTHDEHIKYHRKKHHNYNVPHVRIYFKNAHKKPNELNDDDKSDKHNESFH